MAVEFGACVVRRSGCVRAWWSEGRSGGLKVTSSNSRFRLILAGWAPQCCAVCAATRCQGRTAAINRTVATRGIHRVMGIQELLRHSAPGNAKRRGGLFSSGEAPITLAAGLGCQRRSDERTGRAHVRSNGAARLGEQPSLGPAGGPRPCPSRLDVCQMEITNCRPIVATKLGLAPRSFRHGFKTRSDSETIRRRASIYASGSEAAVCRSLDYNRPIWLRRSE